jgi:hypothetical protein
MLKSEDLLKGLFPGVSLEMLYMNLYNISKLRDVEKVIDSLGRHDYRVEEDVVNEKLEPALEQDIKGFIGYLKDKKPMISSIFETLDIRIENGNVVVFLDRQYSFIKDDSSMKGEIKKHLKDFFGKELGLILKDAGEIKKSVLEEYVKEAETLFKI